MELKDYTEEQLKAELKRRVELRKAQKAEKMKTAKRCRNCKHCVSNSNWRRTYMCMIRTLYPIASNSIPTCRTAAP